jgi:hypothetical protein
MLSGWIVGVSVYKDKENNILQGQLDSLIYVTNIIHSKDTAQINVNHYLPTKRLNHKDKFKDIVIIHSVVIGCFMIFVFLYFRYLKLPKTDNEKKKGWNLFKIKKKIN